MNHVEMLDISVRLVPYTTAVHVIPQVDAHSQFFTRLSAECYHVLRNVKIILHWLGTTSYRHVFISLSLFQKFCPRMDGWRRHY